MAKPKKPTVYGPSLTKPGQALIPSELLKRHLAGTMPDIDLSKNYEYHYDENGEQIGEPFPLEAHELYALAREMRQKQFEANVEAKKAAAAAEKQAIIDEYIARKKAEDEANAGKLPEVKIIEPGKP